MRGSCLGLIVVGACALRADGTVRCWGFNGFGALGVGSIGPAVIDDVRTTPSTVVL